MMNPSNSLIGVSTSTTTVVRLDGGALKGLRAETNLGVRPSWWVWWFTVALFLHDLPNRRTRG